MAVDKEYSLVPRGTGKADYTKTTFDNAVKNSLDNLNATMTSGVINTNIAALSLGVIDVNLLTQTLSELNVNIIAQALAALNVNIAGQDLAEVNMNLNSQSANMLINIADQSNGISLATDWATRKAKDFHVTGDATTLGVGATATLITITLLPTTEHTLYTIHVSGTQNGYCAVRTDLGAAGFDYLVKGYFVAANGFCHTFTPPVQRRKDEAAGVTEITVIVTNNGGADGDFTATFEGITIPDEGFDDFVYTTQADWAGCASSSQINIAEIADSVILGRL